MSDYSIESLIAVGTGLVSRESYMVPTTKSKSDGYSDEIFASVTRSVEDLSFIDTFALVSNRNATDKIRMLKKIKATYGFRSHNGNSNACASIESFCNRQIHSLEETQEATADATSAPADKPNTTQEQPKDGTQSPPNQEKKKWYQRFFGMLKTAWNKFIGALVFIGRKIKEFFTGKKFQEAQQEAGGPQAPVVPEQIPQELQKELDSVKPETTTAPATKEETNKTPPGQRLGDSKTTDMSGDFPITYQLAQDSSARAILDTLFSLKSVNHPKYIDYTNTRFQMVALLMTNVTKTVDEYTNVSKKITALLGQFEKTFSDGNFRSENKELLENLNGRIAVLRTATKVNAQLQIVCTNLSRYITELVSFGAFIRKSVTEGNGNERKSIAVNPNDSNNRSKESKIKELYSRFRGIFGFDIQLNTTFNDAGAKRHLAEYNKMLQFKAF